MHSLHHCDLKAPRKYNVAVLRSRSTDQAVPYGYIATTVDFHTVELLISLMSRDVHISAVPAAAARGSDTTSVVVV